MNPLIGITTSVKDGQQYLDSAYVNAVREAKGLSLLMPCINSSNEANQLCNQIHGLIIPGGPGITINTRGTLPPQLEPISQKRWESDLLILSAAVNKNLPILGICYGMQLLCVRAGGSLYSDVENQVPNAFVHSEKRGASYHPINIVPDSHFARIWNPHLNSVNSCHFQAVRDPGANYRVSARSPDGTIEAIEHINGLHLGVQFHPERMDAQFIFAHLVKQSIDYSHAP